MERLTVENFLGIKQADLEVARFTVIIGPQASGKSVLAKLVYFFRRYLLLSVVDSVLRPRAVEQVEKEWVDQFYTFFPKYSWGSEPFEIVYINEKVNVRLGRSSDARHLEIKLEGFDALCREVDAGLADEPATTDFFKSLGPDSNILPKASVRRVEAMFLEQVGQTKSLFIPAGRSFLSILQQNAFTLFRENPELDPVMWDFGARLEAFKRFHAEDALENESDPFSIRCRDLIDKVLMGKYRRADDQDWIDTEERTVMLSDASSGQQSALPMFLALSSREMRLSSTSIIIEEPEAHLFPDSQQHVVRLLALFHRRYAMQFLVTTHSPYILAALNNLIIAEEISEKLGEESIRDVVGGGDFLLPYDDVRAYSIQDGRLVSILDEESRLIGVNAIDGVSEVLSEEFDELLSLKCSWVEA